MTGTTMAVLIVGIVMCTAAFKEWTKTRRKEAEVHGAGLGEEAAAKLKALEDRVRVLERIATDKGARLKEEIDAL